MHPPCADGAREADDVFHYKLPNGIYKSEQIPRDGGKKTHYQQQQ